MKNSRRVAMALLVVVLTSSVLVPSESFATSDYTKELSEILYSRLTHDGIEVTEAAREHLDEALQKASKQLAADGPSAEQLELAKRNSERLAKEIVEATRKAKRKSASVETITIAFRICPLYPFCK